MSRRWLFLLPILLCLGKHGVAQNWSGVLAPARAIDWSQAGAGSIPTNRIQCVTSQCSTVSGGTVTLSSINAAITSAPAGTYVLLPAGSWTITGGINMKSNVTLRGMGPDQTTLVFSSSGSCYGIAAGICIWSGDSNWAGGPKNVANWTAGYAKGATSITLSSVTNLKVGQLLELDQTDDPSDPGDIYVCGNMTTCGWSGNVVVSGRSGRRQAQIVTVKACGTSTPGAACTSTTVTINPGLYAPNWNRYPGTSLPQAWYASALPISGVGIENLTLDYRSVATLGGGVLYISATGNWVKNVRSLGSSTSGNQIKHVLAEYSAHNTIRDGYFYGGAPNSEAYAIDFGYTSSDNLAENNICQHLPGCMVTEGGAGNVHGYNYAVDNYFGTDTIYGSAWMQNDSDHHSVGDYYLLWEGNTGSGFAMDGIHGGSFMVTAFRNRYSGRDPVGVPSPIKTQSTVAQNIYALSRYVNSVGNVLGTGGYHTYYQTAAASSSDSGHATAANLSVFNLGFSGASGSVNGSFPDDLLVASTLMRWGNYDTVTNDVRWCTANGSPIAACGGSERAESAPVYPGLSNPSQTLPASFYLLTQPSWWGTMPWPAIGPDVTSGNVANVGGHAYLTPSANCYLRVMGGKTDGSSGILSFNADNCYGNSVSVSPPTGLSAIVN